MVTCLVDAAMSADDRGMRMNGATGSSLIAERKVADVVYGSRFYGRPHRSLFYHHFLANKLISVLFNILYNQTLTDIEVCYKMFTREVLNSLRLGVARAYWHMWGENPNNSIPGAS